jgi:hypothetical protein
MGNSKIITKLIDAFKERHGKDPNEKDLEKIISWAKVISKDQTDRLIGQLKR